MPTSDVVDVEFQNVVKRFGEVLAVDQVSFSISQGSFYSFLGPSGCGKTTILRMIAGFEQPNEGEIFIAGESVIGVPPYHRQTNMVFQDYALFPHMTVGANVGYGLRQRRPRISKVEIENRTLETLALVQLPGYEQRRVWELSGGQQQRVALARALINKPKVLLLDEPLAALDRKLRKEMQVELKTLQQEVGITFVFVTHDQKEALSLSDRVAVMKDGRIVQEGSPTELYNQPINRYVADFIGESNFWTGEVIENGDWTTIRTEKSITLRAPRPTRAEPLPLGSQAVIAVRPERIQMFSATDKSKLPKKELIQAPGRILHSTFQGEQTEFYIVSEQLGQVLIRGEAGSGTSPGDEVVVAWQPAAGLSLQDNKDYDDHLKKSDIRKE